MSSGEIWHDICVDCRPEMDMAICGTKIESNHETLEGDNVDEADGQNCVVCMSMDCPTCPESTTDNEIVGRLS